MNRHAIRFLFVAGLLSFSGCGDQPSQTATHIPEVTVAIPIAKEVTDYEDFTGNTDAVEKVDVRARVNGYLVKVAFRDGEYVKKGDLLYQIDPRPFQADLDQALGNVDRLEAQKKLLAIQVDRYRKLAEKGAGSQQDLDQYLAQQAENIGSLKTAEAQVEQAKLNLGFTTITSPIDGQISRTFMTEGNLVNADTTLLTTIMSVDPMYAYFTVEEPALLEIRKLIRDGVITAKDIKNVGVRMGLANDVKGEFPLQGALDFSNNTLNPQTGTMQIRGKFPNKTTYAHDDPPMLLPGLFIRVRLALGPPTKKMLITERAIGTDQGEKFVYVVDKDNKVVYRRIELGQMFGGLQAVNPYQSDKSGESGLRPDERIVVNGLQRIRQGIEVKPKVIGMNEADSSLFAKPQAGNATKPQADKDAKPQAGKTAK
jgi:RND family efflux transporter MFP subunit